VRERVQQLITPELRLHKQTFLIIFAISLVSSLPFHNKIATRCNKAEIYISFTVLQSLFYDVFLSNKKKMAYLFKKIAKLCHVYSSNSS